MNIRYQSGHVTRFIDLTKVESMDLVETSLDGDKALKLIIYYDSKRVDSIMEIVGYRKTGEVGPKGEVFAISEYPLEKLRKLANAFLKYKTNTLTVTEINKLFNDGTQTQEQLTQQLSYK